MYHSEGPRRDTSTGSMVVLALCCALPADVQLAKLTEVGCF